MAARRGLPGCARVHPDLREQPATSSLTLEARIERLEARIERLEAIAALFQDVIDDWRRERGVRARASEGLRWQA